MTEEKRCENCRFYCAGNGQCAVQVWDNGKVYQMDPEKTCTLYEKA